MQHAASRLLHVACLAATLAACSTEIPRHDSGAAERARYAAYAGPPIDSFTWLGRFYSWDALGQNQLVIFTTPNDVFLLTVRPPCSDLNFVQTVGLTATGSTVRVNLDAVLVKGWNCPIEQIRSVDYARLRADERAAAGKS